jgi:hypothetical protein
MRLLILSNVPGSVDKVVEVLQQGNNVVAKELTMANEAIAREAREALKAGSCDLVLVIAKDPIGAGMVLNKREEIEAAVCDSADDVKLAKGNSANVIVIKDANSGALGDMLAEMSGKGGVSQRKLGIKMPSFGRRQEPGEEAEEEKESRSPAPKNKASAPRKEPEGDDEEGGDEGEEDSEGEEKLESISAKRKGPLGKLKNALGIL